MNPGGQTPSDASGWGRALFRCEVCSAEYTRPDHLTRHAATHKAAPSHICTICGRGFSRLDVLKRHERTHGVNNSKTIKRPLPDDGAAPTGRVSQACTRCAAKKLKCSDEKPCTRCRDQGILCEYAVQNYNPIHGFEQHLAPPPPAYYPHHSQDPAAAYANHVGPQQTPQHATSYPPDIHASPGSSAHVPSQPYPSGMTFMGPHGPQTNLPLASLHQHDQQEDNLFTLIDGGLPDFTEVLGEFLQPGNVTTPGVGKTTGIAGGGDTDMIDNVVGSLADAYSNSVFKPAEFGDTKEEDEPHGMELDPAPYRSEHRGHRRPRIEVSASARDRLLHMTLHGRDQTARDRILSSFPSTDILAALISAALDASVGPSMTVGELLHWTALQDLNQAPAELIGALVSNGAVISQPPAVDRFGHAMQEAVRSSLQRRFDDDPGALRNLKMLQAFYVQQCVGYYSGVSRKIETAEAISTLGSTALRRLGKLRSTGNKGMQISFSDDPQQKWAEWIEQQSWSRLAFYAFILDSHISACRDVQMSLSAVEITTQLPLSQKYWEATTASEWLSMADEGNRFPPGPIFQQLLSNPARLGMFTNTDMDVAAAAVNAAHWALVREFRQLSSMQPESSMWQTFVLTSRQAELRSALSTFRLTCASLQEVRPEVKIFGEALSIHLHAVLEHIHTFAGKPTDEDACESARASVKTWSRTPEARVAAYHAGQILRTARVLEKRKIIGTQSIMLFQAALVLWTYGVATKSEGNKSATSPSPGDRDRHVYIDQEHEMLPSFASMDPNAGPILGVSDVNGEFIPLSNVGGVMKRFRAAVAENWQTAHRNRTVAAVEGFLEKFYLAVVHI